MRSLLSVSEKKKKFKVSVRFQVVADKKKYPDLLRPFFFCLLHDEHFSFSL